MMNQMKIHSAEESLWLALPIVLVIVGLLAALVFLPKQSADERSRASEPTPILTPVATQDKPEVVCAETYDPVCAPSGKTYANSCEAFQAGVTTSKPGPCNLPTPTAVPLPISN